ncbi:M20 metallopeptidase family protein [Sandarakinorhabdus limnophila]|uniref:M20 metallopeptidase family protein n=1 Tax=Sandarakinorhabdus limnophila TaxID=210512 RepID=UPI0026ECBA9B|nr:M20 family metallopeptidase [Sandarakinorhabdus limnophila]MCM0033576.1 M20 family metallopeptidase [Sandarakinorhabdus limnophila]
MIDWTHPAQAALPGMTALRRAIHAEPELGLHNPRTAEKIMAALAGLPLEFRTGPSTTGIIATLKGPANGRTVLLRGDTDALPMPEETGLDFASTIPGAMHACGHDSHVAMLAGAARLLCERRESLAGSVMFMFQPGEEGHHGARYMLDDGLIDPLPDAAFALHIMPNAPWGVVGGRTGALLASNDKLRIVITGRGGHASMPHDALDPVPIACEIALALQTFVTRQISVFDPAVITIGQISAGTTDNVIPETALLFGTMRTLSAATRLKLHDGLPRLAQGIAAAHGASATVEIIPGFPVTNCDGRAVALGETVTKRLFGEDAWQTLANPIMGAEDFAYVLEKVPGAMFFLGVAEQGADWRACCGLHSTHMHLDESAMARGAALHAAIAEQYLAHGFD